jgi:hypothetical protein
MEKQKIRELFLKAENDLSRSQEELNRPAFDVVKYAVCVFGRTAIHRYMECLYLHYTDSNGDKPQEKPTIAEMFEYCKPHNPNLAKMSLFQVHCTGRDVLETEEVFYCNDLHQVKTCSEIAGEIRGIFIKDVMGGVLPQ